MELESHAAVPHHCMGESLMAPRFHHYEPGSYDDDESPYPLYDNAPSAAYHGNRDGALLRRLEHLEEFTRQALFARPPYLDTRAVAEPSAAPKPEPERTLWQGRPTFLASASALLSAALWLWVGWQGLWHLPDTVALLRFWCMGVGEWLWQHQAVAALAWYEQATAWLHTPALAADILTIVLLMVILSAAGVLVSRCWRALRTGYCLTTQRLSTRYSGPWTDVALSDLDRVVVRRPFWGRLLGYVHVQFRGHAPVRRRVHWRGVSQRALLTALLQATLPQADSTRRL